MPIERSIIGKFIGNICYNIFKRLKNKIEVYMMAGNRVICTENNIEYIDIRMAMCKGARTAEEVKEMAGICNECEGCKTELQPILDSVCGCKDVSLQEVIDAVKDGADTAEKVAEKTGAGSVCGRCTKLVENVIELGY